MLGRYRILGELGRGAMGAVYRAVDLVLEREVALKTLLPDLPKDVVDEVRIRFLREARSAGRLSHPNIVTIFDVGQEGQTAYIAMELLEGRSLHQMLKDPQRIPFHTATDIAAQVAEALEHAHKFSIVHRSEEHTSELQSQSNLVCRLLLEKKKKTSISLKPDTSSSFLIQPQNQACQSSRPMLLYHLAPVPTISRPQTPARP